MAYLQSEKKFARYIYNENNRTQFSLFVNNKTLINKNDNVNKIEAQSQQVTKWD